MIKPTIGRVVWLWPCAGVLEDKKIVYRDKTLPLAATVAYVWSDRMVNLAAVDQDGKPFNLTSVLLLQGDETYAPVGSYCEWMPYQKGQAEKAQAVRSTPVAHPLDGIARVCHEANRAYCQALGDMSQPAWEDAPEWQRSSARMGVDLHSMGDFGPKASHVNWMNQKLKDGWKYGPVKDADKKEHPCMVPFADLPAAQQAKDFIFRAIVHAMRDTAPV